MSLLRKSWTGANKVRTHCNHFNQCVPGSGFIFCRAEQPEESLPAWKRLDSKVCTEKLTTGEHDGDSLCLRRTYCFLLCTKEKHFLWKKKGYKNSSSDNQNAQEVDPKALEYIIFSKKKWFKKIQQLAWRCTRANCICSDDCERLWVLYFAHTHNKDYNNHLWVELQPTIIFIINWSII